MERQLWTTQQYALDLIVGEERTYQSSEEECVVCYLALARFARLSAQEMRQGPMMLKWHLQIGRSIKQPRNTTKQNKKSLKATNQEEAAHDECKLPPGNFYSCKGDTDSVKGTAEEGTLCSFTPDKSQDGTVKICLNGYWFIHAEKRELF